MSLAVEVDLTASVPPYEQIRLQVQAHVSAGRLQPGDRLPTIRALAVDLGVAAGTVARAYRELEVTGVVTTRRRTGTVVAPGAVAADDPLQQAAAGLVATLRAAGMSDDGVLDLVRGALLEHRPTSVPAGAAGPAGPLGQAAPTGAAGAAGPAA